MIKKVWKLTLPLSVCLRYPPGSVCLISLQGLLCEVLDKLPIAKVWKKWISFVVRWVPVKGKRVFDFLRTQIYNETSSDWETAPPLCICHELPSTLPRIQGCVIFRTRTEMLKCFTAGS